LEEVEVPRSFSYMQRGKHETVFLDVVRETTK